MFQGKKRSLTQGWAQYYCYCIALFLNTNTIYCNILYHQYNILQYSPPPIQYIAIFSTINTIYCNILHHQYNILVKIYYIVLYCIEIYCFKVDHQSSSSPCSLSSLSEAFSLTTYTTNEGFHSNCFLFRNSSASNVAFTTLISFDLISIHWTQPTVAAIWTVMKTTM